MKIQDIGFLAVFLLVLWLRNNRLTTIIGLACLIGAIPLFYFWVFFTGERLVMYAAGFFALGIVLHILHNSSFWQAKRVQNQILDKPE